MLARLFAFLFRRRADAHGCRGVNRTRAGDGPRKRPTGGSGTSPPSNQPRALRYGASEN